jgi:hypothetical protein
MLDEEALIRKMVFVLRRQSNEWLSFRRLSRLVAIPEIDEDAIAAIAGYRDDIFATSHDRKVKLRLTFLQQTAIQDATNFVLPRHPVNDERRELSNKVARALGTPDGACYCHIAPPTILSEIIGETIPDEALILGCCWITICTVRGPFTHLVSSEVWSELCRRRVEVKHRENPNDL